MCEVGLPPLDYVFVSWEGEEHSVMQGTLVELCNKSSGYVAGAKVKAHFSGKIYVATIITAGIHPNARQFNVLRVNPRVIYVPATNHVHVIYYNRARKRGVSGCANADDGAIFLRAGPRYGAISRQVFLHGYILYRTTSPVIWLWLGSLQVAYLYIYHSEILTYQLQ